MAYTTSHRSHGHGYHGSSQYEQPPVVVAPTYSSTHRSRHHRHHHNPTVVTGTVVSSGHHRSRHHGGHHGSHYDGYGYHLTLGERIRRFFGFRARQHRHKSSSSWGFLGRSRPRRYVDARTGAEVDRKGRPIYHV
uniref:Uncharacterized protein n=1 Tax=Mycena chlorophos TaxID=658473 RepID=A0ABQ0LSG0_MYCCL|nr:predicted protein [Mycena chlorophos]